MNKFLKLLLIIVLIVVSVGGTAYFFFSRLKPDTDYFTELNVFVSGAENVEFEAKLKSVAMYSEGYIFSRFLIARIVNSNLNNSLEALNEHLILANKYGFDDNKIGKEFKNLTASKNKAERIMDEYLTKIPGIPQGSSLSIPANDVYTALAEYFVKYSNFLKTLNNELKVFKLNKNVDLKYSLIEIYANSCINAFSNLTYRGDLVYIETENEHNIIYTSRCVNLIHSYVNLTSKENFSYLNNLFIKSYNLCDKVDFANNLYKYVEIAGEEVDSTLSSEIVTAVYFKKIFEF